MSPALVLTERRGRVLVATLARPPVNALDDTLIDALHAVLDVAIADAGIAVLHIRSRERVFSAGADLALIRSCFSTPGGPDAMTEVVRHMQRLYERLEAAPLATIAEIGAAALGGGLELALACDLRVAADDARFGAAFHRVGLGSDFGVTWLLPRVVGPARAAELLLLADPVDAPQALAMGLCSRVVPTADLDREARALAARLAAGPALAQAFTKRGLRRAPAGTLGELLEWEALAQAVLSKTADAAEGVAAFREKRPPRFQGR